MTRGVSMTAGSATAWGVGATPELYKYTPRADGLRAVPSNNREGIVGTSYDERRGDLIVLLRTMTTAGETLQRGDSGGRFEPGPKILSMPAAWHAGSYRQLCDALKVLAKHGPRHYWNVDARYISPLRTNKDLVYRGSRYFEARPKLQDGELFYYAGDPLDLSCREVLAAKTEPKARVLREHGKPQATLVRAIVETWDRAVERRPLELGLDFLLANMPARIRLPREVAHAA